MTDFVRRLVSGGKSRFRDEDLDLELDLAYITDRVIVMGYPAEGLEGLYRNRREDAIKFLGHRHGKNFWVFNFCPVKENSYSASIFDERVSRYPFPDHHAPPLAILPLVAREIKLWLDESSERVVVLHCKAGKGRSGTMACAYLLSLDDPPNPPLFQRSHSKSLRAKKRAEQLMDSMPADDTPRSGGGSQAQRSPLEADPVMKELSDSNEVAKFAIAPVRSTSPSDGLKHVLKLHTSRRMKRPSSPSDKVKQGVSIPSQRRWLYYWSLLLAHQEPVGFWSRERGSGSPPGKVRITEMKVRMRELSGIKSNLVKAANVIMDRTNHGKGTHLRNLASVSGKKVGQVWVSLARYDDELVNTLETWEQRTRSKDGKMGKREPGSEDVDGESLGEMFSDSRWDAGKMVRSFARMGMSGDVPAQSETTEQKEKIISHVLRPLGGEKWVKLRQSLVQDDREDGADSGIESEETSMEEDTEPLNTKSGVVLDSNREVRVKLYYGQVFMGWFWFIPVFHISPRTSDTPSAPTMWTLTRKEVDFPLGVGSLLVDVEVTMEWCTGGVSENLKAPVNMDERLADLAGNIL